jgi:molybdopterin adenylyltransferase
MVLEHQSHQSGHAHEQHKAHAPHCVTCVVITCSDTRTSQTDTSGQLMMRLLKEHGHDLAGYHVIKDDPAQIRSVIEEAAAHDAVQAILVNGGTGISKRDSTFEAVDGMLEKRLVGFGEIFRYLTYKDIGSSAIMTRATAGIFRRRIIFSTPGSEGAVRLAMESLILPELGHIVQQLNK